MATDLGPNCRGVRGRTAAWEMGDREGQWGEGGGGEGFEWPPVSFARMRAGFRSAVGTECSAFKYQSGGRSLRWVRGRMPAALPEEDMLWAPAADVEAHAVRAQWLWSPHGVALLKLLLPPDALDGDEEDNKAPHKLGLWSYLRHDLMFGDSMLSLKTVDAEAVQQTLEWALCPVIAEDGTKRFRSRRAYHFMRGALTPPIGASFIQCADKIPLLVLVVKHGWEWLRKEMRTAAIAANCQIEFCNMILMAEAHCGHVDEARYWMQQAVENEIVFSESEKMELAQAVGASGSCAMLEWWLEMPHCEHSAHEIRTVAWNAAARGHEALYKSLADLRGRQIVGQTAGSVVQNDMEQSLLCLSAAAAEGHEALTMRIWTEAGADLVRYTASNHQYCEGMLGSIAEQGRAACVRFLHGAGFASGEEPLQRSDDVAAPTAYRSSPGTLETLEYLIENGLCLVSYRVLKAALTTHLVRQDVVCYLLRHAPADVIATLESRLEMGDDHRTQGVLRWMQAQLPPSAKLSASAVDQATSTSPSLQFGTYDMSAWFN